MRETTAKLTGVLGEHALPYTERIFEHLLGCSRTDLYLTSNRDFDSRFKERLSSIVRRCLEHEPLDYIFGASYFFNREFVVSPPVMLPRPDTELLVEQVLYREETDGRIFADIGTGSGIIACILTEQRPQWRGVGIDISEVALSVAQRNLTSDRVRLVCADLLSAVTAERCFDFIVCNPPYIRTADIANLDESVSRFEPHGALDGGADGLDCYRRIAREAPVRLKAGGALYGEIGYDQEEAARLIFSDPPWQAFQCHRDLAGNPRVIIARTGG